jgi:hypothetical protein
MTVVVLMGGFMVPIIWANARTSLDTRATGHAQGVQYVSSSAETLTRRALVWLGSLGVIISLLLPVAETDAALVRVYTWLAYVGGITMAIYFHVVAFAPLTEVSDYGLSSIEVGRGLAFTLFSVSISPLGGAWGSKDARKERETNTVDSLQRLWKSIRLLLTALAVVELSRFLLELTRYEAAFAFAWPQSLRLMLPCVFAFLAFPVLHPSVRGSFVAIVARFGSVRNEAAITALVGGTRPSVLLEKAQEQFRLISFDDLHGPDDMPVDGSASEVTIPFSIRASIAMP